MRWLSWLLLLLSAPAAAAIGGGGPNHIAATLVAESAAVPPGGTVQLAFAMQPQAGWHGYWQNPGDAGFETRVAWNAPTGLRFGALRYPVPQPLLIGGLMNYVYERDYALLVTATAPADAKPGAVLPVTAKLDWLACNPSVCVPESATLSTRLAVGEAVGDSARTQRFDRWRAALPRPLGATAHYQVTDGRFRLEVPLPAGVALDKPWFFAAGDSITYAAPEKIVHDGDRLVVETAAKLGIAGPVAGVLRLGDDTGVSLSASPGIVAPAADGRIDWAPLLAALGGAILGGLLLNVMPCVFPILSLKALSLARAGGGAERAARREALAYTAGVVAVCLGLGALLLGLRAGGSAAGWAFQLQDPRVIAALLLLVLAIGLNLAGLFELPVLAAGGGLAAKEGVAGAFWTGALAAFVATPCAGPFLGTALGAALLLPAWGALAVFGGLGLGLALPFLLLGFVPPLRRRLPRPGAWMDTLRRLLAVPMLLTALGLAWVLGRQAGVDGMSLGLLAALLLALGLWWTGQRQGRLAPRSWLPALPALAVAVLLVAAVPRFSAAPTGATMVAGGEEPFAEARLATLRQQGRPVFVYFTADWCLTCKVNEAAAIQRDEVTRAFADHHVAVLMGDWTRGDPAITRFLAAHGRSGVPFYLYYPAGGAEPRELPQVLTPGMLAGLA
jgi:DsbC/DsbD-like thiol-disulfide interchange protein/cytochrome c biogenesis protein CcdA